MDQTSEKPHLPPRVSSRSHQESGERKGYESASTERASIQDVLLFLAPPILSAAVLAAIGVNLPRIPSPHPLADAIILCAGAMALAITLWWLLSFLSILWEECVVRRRSTGLNSTYGSRLPRVFTLAFVRRVILAMGSASIGLSALFAPAQALPGTYLSTPASADGSAKPIQASVPQDSALQESVETSRTTGRQECSTQEITAQSDSASTIIPMGGLYRTVARSFLHFEILLAPIHTQYARETLSGPSQPHSWAKVPTHPLFTTTPSTSTKPTRN